MSLREKWTLQSVWYRMLPILDRNNIRVKRQTLIGYVKKHCDIRHITRASIGIFAGVRAELYFKGEWKSVSFDAINELAEKGTDIMFIEKQGIAEVITEHADKYGIAMVNTRGYLTEYGNDLMNAASSSGANVVIMTDYDLTGINIASQIPSEIPWIGIDQRTFEYFNLNRDSNDITVQATNVKLSGTVEEKVTRDSRFSDVDIEFLKKKRVEIDAVLAKVGGERLFEFILDRLKELYPKRDYNRAIDIPTELDAEHEKSLEIIDKHIGEIIKNESNEVKQELKQFEGFTEVNKKEKEIKQRLKNVLADSTDYKDFTSKLKELVGSHPFFKNNNNNKNKNSNTEETY
jgi:Protein of unknown function C-terminus (DUF2399)